MAHPMVSDADRARAEIERRRRERIGEIVREPLYDYIPRVTPTYSAPHHLAPLVSVIERIKRGEPVFCLVSVPPQHGKSQTILHGLGQCIGIFPDRQYAYVSYEKQISLDNSVVARRYAANAGIPLKKQFRASRWQTPAGGGLIATSIGGPLTGQPISGGLVIDDPFKNRADAESIVVRNKVHGWATSTGFSRLHPTAFVIVVHTRWHEDDLIGRLATETIELDDGSLAPKWEIINLPAIADNGEALWEKGRPLRFLRNLRRSIGEYDFSALFQGRPRPRGHNVFRGVRHYDSLPRTYRITKGLDLAYSGKNRADWSVAVVLYESDGDVYVVDVVRKRCEVRAFIPELQRLDAMYPGEWNFVCSGMEKALIGVAPTDGVEVNVINAVSDKFARAQPVAARWNGDPGIEPGSVMTPGRVFVPRQAPWLKDFLEELNTFTGVGDVHDDQVDALAGAFEPLRVAPVEYDDTYDYDLPQLRV